MTATSLLDGFHIHPQTAGDSWGCAVRIRKFLSVILCCLLQYYLWPSISIVLVCHVYSIVIMVCTVTCTGEDAICINFYNGPTALKFSPLAKLQGFLASEPPPRFCHNFVNIFSKKNNWAICTITKSGHICTPESKSVFRFGGFAALRGLCLRPPLRACTCQYKEVYASRR